MVGIQIVHATLTVKPHLPGLYGGEEGSRLGENLD